MILKFNDGDYPLMVAAWTIGTPPGNKTTTNIIYQWGLQGTASGYLVVIQKSMDDVLAYIDDNTVNGVCDLTPLQ